jgi:hypothetical protein
MKSAILLSLLFSSFSAFAAKEIELKKCTSTFRTDNENQYSPGHRVVRDFTVNVKLIQIKKALQKNSNFVVDFGIIEKSEDNSYTSTTGGTTPPFKALSGAIRENLDVKSNKINSVENVILQVKKLLEKDAKETGSNLENLELGDIKLATVYPVNAFQDERINLIIAKDAVGTEIATILTIDETVVSCK